MEERRTVKSIFKRGLALFAASSLLLSSSTSFAAENPSEHSIEINQVTAGAVTALNGAEDMAADVNTLVTAGAVATMVGFEEDYSMVQENVETTLNENDEWTGKLMANTEEQGVSTEVYAEPSADTDLAGKLRTGDVAEINNIENGWCQITSGNLEGYIATENVVIGHSAKALSEKVCPTYAISTTNCLRVRKGPSTDTKVLKFLHDKQRLRVEISQDALEEAPAATVEVEQIVASQGENAEDADVDADDKDNTNGAGDWIPVTLNATEAYLSSDYVTLETEYGQGVTVEEEGLSPEELEANRAAEEELEPEVTAEEIEATEDDSAKDAAVSEDGFAQEKDATPTQNPPVAAGADDVTLLGALIQCEAGGCPYEGMLAVGAVVVNRMRSGYGGGTLRGVIFQPGQFTPALNGGVDRRLAAGVNPACIQAAQEALAGADNTGGCLNFRAAWTGHPGNNIGGNVFF